MPIVRLDTAETKEKLDAGWTYVDVRTEEEWDEGHPPGAVNVPVAIMSARGKVQNPEFLAAMNATFAKDAKIVLGCAAGVRSMIAAELLVADGFVAPFEHRPGWYGVRDPFGRVREVGWEASGLPIESGGSPERSWTSIRKKLTP